jgi:hypothetical protein
MHDDEKAPPMISRHLERTSRRGLTIGAVVVALLLGLQIPSQAAPMLVLSTPSDLSSLNVGEVVTFDVVLSGLMPGDELEYLSANIDTPLFMVQSSPTAGPIADPMNFTGSSFPGGVDGFFDSFFGLNPGANIVSNGVFYSFSLKATTPGSGAISFSSALAALDLDPIVPDFADSVATGDPLQFTIAPEPASFAIFASGILFFGLLCARRRRTSADLA